MKKFASILALAATAAFAQNEAPAETKKTSEPHTHDGFYLSISLGLGYQSADVAEEWDDETSNFSGLTTDIDVKVGFRIANNVLLHLTLMGDTPTETEKDDGDEFKANLSMFGIGSTFYFMDNYLATASIGIGQFRYSDDISVFQGQVTTSTDRYSQTGFAFQLGFGKEWWVSDNWGIGATASLLYGFAYNMDDTRESSISISARLTATYN